jgi:hypothetical protein
MIDSPNAELALTLPDGSVRRVPYGTLPRDVVAGIGAGLLRAAVAVQLDGQIQDLVTPLRQSGAFRVLTEKDALALDVLRRFGGCAPTRRSASAPASRTASTTISRWRSPSPPRISRPSRRR